MPRFDERFNHYGEDKVQFFYSLFMKGFSFHVLSAHFAVHVNHTLAPWAQKHERSKHTEETIYLEHLFEEETVDNLANAEAAANGVQQTHEVTVQPGNTLHAIAVAAATSVAYLKEMNGMAEVKNPVLNVGQKLNVPTFDIKVKPADSTWKIAKRYYITQELFRAFNGLRDDVIYVGQKLHIPVFNERVYQLWQGHQLEPGKSYAKSVKRAHQERKANEDLFEK
jgi:LysM repeat protein